MKVPSFATDSPVQTGLRCALLNNTSRVKCDTSDEASREKCLIVVRKSNSVRFSRVGEGRGLAEQ